MNGTESKSSITYRVYLRNPGNWGVADDLAFDFAGGFLRQFLAPAHISAHDLRWSSATTYITAHRTKRVRSPGAASAQTSSVLTRTTRKSEGASPVAPLSLEELFSSAKGRKKKSTSRAKTSGETLTTAQLTASSFLRCCVLPSSHLTSSASVAYLSIRNLRI